MKATRYTQEMIQEYLQKGYWEADTFPEIWDRNAAQHPDEEAIIDSRTRLTWSQAKQQIDRIALGLMNLGIGRDEVLVTELFNCVELMLIYIACQKAGIINLNVIRTMRHRELEHVLKFTEASSAVIPWRFRDFDYWDMIQNIRPNQVAHLSQYIGEPLGVIFLIDIFNILRSLFGRLCIVDIIDIEAQCLGKVIKTMQLEFFLVFSRHHILPCR